jgi:hypothetical protein
MTEAQAPRRISINGYLVDFLFQFTVVDVWPGLDGAAHVWLVDASPATLQLMKIMSMWGGPTRKDTIDGVYREAWEIHKDMIPALRSFIEQSTMYRLGKDTATL